MSSTGSAELDQVVPVSTGQDKSRLIAEPVASEMDNAEVDREAVSSISVGEGAPTGESMASPTNGVRVARNVVTTLITQLLTWAMSFAVVLYTPAYLGPAGMGKLSFAMAFATVIAAVAPLGTSTVLVKEVARDRSRVTSLLLSTLLLRIPIGIGAAAAAYGIARAMRLPHEESLIVLLCASGALFAMVNEAVVSALQGLEMLPRQNAVAVVEKLVWAGVSIGLVVTHGRLWQFAMVGWISSGLAAACNLTAFSRDIRKMAHGAMRPDFAALRSLVVAGLPFLGWSVCVTLYGQTDPLVIRFVTGRSLDIGWYSVTTKLVGTTLFLPSALATALLPTLSRLHQEDPTEFRKLANRMLSIAMICGVPIAFVLGTMPDRIMAILPYGHRFAEAGTVLRIGGFGLLLWYLGITIGTVVIARDGQKRMFGAAVTAALVGVPLCALCARLTYLHFGNAAIGAISSDCLIELYLVVRYFLMVPRGILDWSALVYGAKCTAAAAPMAVVLWYAIHWNVGVWATIPCIAVYVIMCRMLNCFGAQDITMLRRLMAKKA